MSLKDKAEEWWIASEFTLSKNQFIAVIILGILIVTGWLIYYIGQPSQASEIQVTKPVNNKPRSMALDKVFVHVAGAVKKPGVYKVSSGSRMIDAIKQAGGFTKGADQDSLNLAAKVKDSQKIQVLFRELTTSGGKPAISSTPEPSIINLNTATEDQLNELPGIGETMAKRILDYRQEIGGFSSIDQLKDIEGIGEKKFEKMKEKVTL